jgi:Zn-dependent protease
MLRSFKLGTAFGIPLFVHSTFLLLPAWVLFSAWGGGAGFLLLALLLVPAVFGCVLLHELGHALMARHFGIATRDITLYPIGGVARLESTGTTPLQELCIALAGPAVNLALVVLLPALVAVAAVAGLLGGGELLSAGSGLLPLVAQFVFVLWLANCVLLGFNLLPAFPMDGGRVLRALLARKVGNLRATEIAAPIGLGVALLLGAYGLYARAPFLALVALFVAFAGQAELRALRRREAERRAAAAAEPFPFAEPFVEPIFARVEPTASRPGFTGFVWDRERRVWVRWLDGRPREVIG